MPSDDPAGPTPPADLPAPHPDVPGDPAAPAPAPPSETPGDPAAPILPPGIPGAPGDPDPSNEAPPDGDGPEPRAARPRLPPETTTPETGDPETGDPEATDPHATDTQAADPRATDLEAADREAADLNSADPRPDAPAAEAATAEPAAPNDAPGAPGAMEDALRLAEGLIFASATPVPASRLATLLGGADPEPVLAALAARYAGRGVTLSPVAGGWSFRTAADLAPALTTVIETPRRLPRAAMEALAIIAWHQPVTRPEIEEIRGTALSQPTLELLLENALIAPRGRKESPGRPTLWATTPRFLEQFGLASLRDLPRREDLLPDPVLPLDAGSGGSGRAGEGTAPISRDA